MAVIMICATLTTAVEGHSAALNRSRGNAEPSHGSGANASYPINLSAYRDTGGRGKNRGTDAFARRRLFASSSSAPQSFARGNT